MAMRGNDSKIKIYKLLKDTFPSSFMVDTKVMRVPFVEDGVPVEIKVSLTAAKDIMGQTEGGEQKNLSKEINPHLTEQEKKNVEKLAAAIDAPWAF